jgi:hypothetical protein|tara:strand:- start:605 stop:757 length:153 start_codon:yes stop_codon:yes gene_type:complete
MSKKKLVTCSPFKLIMGYEYSSKQDRQRCYDRERSRKYYAKLKKRKNENI